PPGNSQQLLGVLRVIRNGLSVAAPYSAPPLPRFRRSETGATYETMSLSFLSGRILTTLRAGLALKIVSSFVNGLMPLRSLVAGLCCTTILQRPGIAKVFEPLRPTAFLICSFSASNTLLMSRFERPVVSAMLAKISVLDGGLVAFAIVLYPPDIKVQKRERETVQRTSVRAL